MLHCLLGTRGQLHSIEVIQSFPCADMHFSFLGKGGKSIILPISPLSPLSSLMMCRQGLVQSTFQITDIMGKYAQYALFICVYKQCRLGPSVITKPAILRSLAREEAPLNLLEFTSKEICIDWALEN